MTQTRARVQPQTPPSSPGNTSNVGLGVGLGLGLPLALAALSAAALFGFSAYTGTPVVVLLGKVTGGLFLGGKAAAAKLGSTASSAASQGRVSQLGQASLVASDASAPDTTSLLRSGVKGGSGRYGGV